MMLRLFHQLTIVLIFILINQIHSFDSSNVVSVSKRAAEAHWTYSDQREWISLNGSQCGGDRQSPIDLDSAKAKVDKTLTLDTHSYDKLIDPESGFVFSTGHSLRLNIRTPGTYAISGTAVESSVYELVQVHIHWGTNSMTGSEHSIDGERFSAEIHFVHVNKKYSNDTGLALKNPDGLTVLGVIAKNGDPNPGLQVLIEAMESNRSNENYRLKSTFNLNHFLPKNMKSFFKYAGSLTTPTCEEVVNWIVMKDMITVSNDQIDVLRHLIDDHGDTMITVVRDLQGRQGRTIFQSDSGVAMLPTLTILCYIILYLVVHLTLIQKSILD